MNVCEEAGNNFIRGYFGIRSRLIFNVDFKGFIFSKVYKRFEVQKVKKGVFYVVEFIIWLFRGTNAYGSEIKTYDDTSFGIVIMVWIEIYVVVFTGGFTVNLEF